MDIRESFPLLDVLEVIDEKKDLRFDKFRDKETGIPLVITTNFLLTTLDQDGKEVLMARSVKSATELNRRLTIEKLEIERRYWEAKRIDWKLITDKQISKQYVKNIEWVRESIVPNQTDSKMDEQANGFLTQLLQYEDLKLQDVLHAYDRQEGVQSGSGLYLFRYLIAKKQIRIDMNKALRVSDTVRHILL